jgi:hypothetical protein|tara:strand:- start:123 stop:353 length:231 start_codon:yes stop_codon:yes gene_type:complete
MSFAKKFCAKSPFKKSQADVVLVKGAGDAVEKVDEHGLEKASKVVSSFAKNCDCWKGYERVPGTKPCTKKSCRKKR